MKEEKEEGQKWWPYRYLLPPADQMPRHYETFPCASRNVGGERALSETRNQIPGNLSSPPTGADQAPALR